MANRGWSRQGLAFALLTVGALSSGLSSASLAQPAGARVEAGKGATQPLRNPDYAGRLVGEAGGRIFLQIRRSDDGRKYVRIQIRNSTAVCESGEMPLTYLNGSKRISPDGSFTALYADGPADSGQNQVFSLVRGRFLEHGRAKGFAFRMVEVFDEPSGSFEADECWSDGIVRWTAHRVAAGDSKQPRRSPQSQHSPHLPRRAVDRYQGSMLDLAPSAGPLALTVEGRVVRFETTIRLTCDGPSRTKKLGPITARLRADNSFERAIFDRRRGSDRAFTWLRGRVEGGKAHGLFAHFDDPWDPAGTSNRRECGTPFEYRWAAR